MVEQLITQIWMLPWYDVILITMLSSSIVFLKLRWVLIPIFLILIGVIFYGKRK